MIEAVLFDMGGTLETYSYSDEIRKKATPELHELLVFYGIDLSLSNDELYKLISTGLKAYKTYSIASEEELSSARIWTEYLLKDYPQYHHLLRKNCEALMYWVDVHYYERKLRPEVQTVLSDLHRRGYKLGLISNIASTSQVPENLKLYGIFDYFSVIVLSSEYGRRKPDPAIFHHAATKIGAPASHCAYVGDRVVRDIIGARRAGYGLAVQIIHNFDHGEPDDGPSADAVIHNLQELAPIIQEFNLKQMNELTHQKVKALFFDAGDILYYRPRRGQPLADFLLRNGVDHPDDFQQAVTVVKEKAYNGELNRTEYFVELVRAYGISDPEEIQAGSNLLARTDDDIVFFSGVAETLRALKQKGYLLGIITDTAVPTSDKLRWFEAGGFGDVWDAFISSREVGVQKPDTLIYQAALRQVNLPADKACFIGHDAEELDGAGKAGFHTIAFNPDPLSRAEYTADTFSDLITILEDHFSGEDV